MPRVFLGLGSNRQRHDNLSAALDALLLEFRDLALSPVFESAPLAGEGAPYLNLVVAFETELLLPQLNEHCKALETKLGRRREGEQTTEVPLDIDILTYGKLTGRSCGLQLPRPEIASAAHVLWPLAVLAPREKHPLLQRTYAELWQDFDRSGQSIRPVDFTWHERQISSAQNL
ncbi:MAG TPA: 2-amino-4-hydroxy-6-hydroxymethyldihydropteridine diphosphokinase [Hyphomicrobiales bacterium]|nr:2-amino-4-hydroxy-6-hydroxymethyldihydropteridine diphosphokinase [Hyphomicrobiales bacterium]